MRLDRSLRVHRQWLGEQEKCDWVRYILCKIHIDGSRYHAVVPGVFPVSPVIGRTPLDVVDHALEQPDLPPFWLTAFREGGGMGMLPRNGLDLFGFGSGARGGRAIAWASRFPWLLLGVGGGRGTAVAASRTGGSALGARTCGGGHGGQLTRGLGGSPWQPMAPQFYRKDVIAVNESSRWRTVKNSSGENIARSGGGIDRSQAGNGRHIAT